MIARGQIRWFRFASPAKRRPVLVLGRDDLLPSLSLIPIIPLSTQIRGLPWEVPLGTVERAALGPLLSVFPDER